MASEDVFEAEDALRRLDHWREALASDELRESSALRLAQAARGSLDLEFVVEVGSGVSDAQLQERLRQEAGRIRELFQEQGLEVRLGAEESERDRGASSSSAGSPAPAIEEVRRSASAAAAAQLQEGITEVEMQDHWMRLEEREREAASMGDFAGWHWRQGEGDAAPRPQSRRGRPASAPLGGRDRVADRAAMDRFNHPTTPSGPRFLMHDSHWQQSKGNRIYERKEREERERKEREQTEVPPFRARPVPASVTTPQYQAMQAAASASGRSRSVEGGERRRERSPRQNSDERREPFKARPVPWRVTLPLYDQMRAEERDSRRQRQIERSHGLLRSSSLPPRLEAEAARARLLEEEDEDSSPKQRRTGPLHPSARQLPVGVSLSSWKERRQAEVSARVAGYSWVSGVEFVASSAGGRRSVGQSGTPGNRKPDRRPEPAETRAISASTTEVPDFKARHERLKQQLDRQKYLNRYVTQPQPFVFNTPCRSQVRPPPMAKEPSQDWRWKRRNTRAASAPRSREFDGEGHFSVKALERAFGTVPPRTTEKVLSCQQATQRRIQERREKEWREKQELQQANEVSSELRHRVKQAIGPFEPLEEKIERIVSDKRQGVQRITRDKLRDLQEIQDRVKRRPLLMEQADSLLRARRRALFRVRSTLEAAGVRDIDSHFRDEELDEFDRAAARGDVEPICA